MDELPNHFTGLPIRPPTPPKEFASDDVAASIGKTFESIRLQPETLYTPNESPVSVTNLPLKTSVKSSKHVGFSPLSPQFGSSGYLSLIGPLRTIPPSRECASRKSILKPCDPHFMDPSTVELKGAAEMLESLCRGLASPTKSSRLDAYMTLIGCLRTYKNVPERDLLENKLSLLSQFIKRDISTDAEDIVDTQIRIQSLKLLSVFLAEPSLSNLLPNDFQCYIVDRAIKVLDEHTASKAIINHHMVVLAMQDFRSSIVTETKALDILAALEDLTDHVKGNGVVGLRQRIYQRLLRQSKPAMIKCVNIWASHLFPAMLSASKETRLQALNFGCEASVVLGTQSRVSNSIKEIFNRRSPTGKKFLSTVIKRLTDMISNDEEKNDVPPVWSVVVMLLRSRPRQLEQWEYMREWMVIIQKCFNSSSSMVKANAALAWNRLVGAVDLNTLTSQGMIRTVKQPIKAQLERSTLPKTSHRAKQMACSSYCTLLYYAFRPQRPADQTSLFWEEFVQGMLLDDDRLLVRIDPEYVFQILTYLFDSGQPWNEKRVAEEPPIRPKDLPSLPPSWVHENASRILSIFQSLILIARWESIEGEDPWVVKAWSGFIGAIGQASGKEIKISMETMSAVAGIMNCFRSYWTMESGDQVTRLQRILVLWKLANADKIHPLAFTECRLIGTCRGNIRAAASPSTHSDQDRASSKRDSAVVFFTKLLCSEPIYENSQETLATVLKEVLGIASRASTTRQNTLKILKDITGDLNTRSEFWELDRILWQSAVDTLLRSVDGTKRYSTLGSSSRPPASDFQEIIEVLEIGLQLDFKPASSWHYPIMKLAESISQEVGNAGLATAFIEPLAFRLQQFWDQSESDSLERNNNVLECTVALMCNVVWPASQQELQDTNLLVWGTASKRAMPLSTDPYSALYPLLAIGLAKGFQYGRYLIANGHIKLFEVSVSLLRSLPVSSSAKVLESIQRGVVMWIDNEGYTDTLLLEGTLALWRACAKIVEGLSTFDTTTAESFEPLLASALTTGYKAILEDALKLWQTTFGLNPDLVVPGSVSEALALIHKKAELAMIESAKSHSNDEMDVDQNVSFYAANTENGNPVLEKNVSASPNTDKPNLPTCLIRVEQEQRIRRPAAPLTHTTPKSSPKLRCSRYTPPKRLRHEDSQIVFAAIHSSPYDTESLVSQFLTAHQREVRERQQSEANAMFPDIRSDSVKRSARKGQKTPTLSMENMNSEQDEPEECSSPILSTKNPIINDFVQSSPTPGPSRHASSSLLPEDGPPSSPPARPTNSLVESDFDQGKELASLKNQMDSVRDQEIKTADVSEPLMDEGSDSEPSLQDSGIQELHERKNEAMDHGGDTEPLLPELVQERMIVRGDKRKQKSTIRPSAPTTPTKRRRIEEDVDEQASSTKSALSHRKDFGGALPDSSDLRLQEGANASLAEKLVSDMDVYVDAPSSLPNTPIKAREQRVHEQIHRNEEGQWVMVASSMQHSGDATLDVGDSTASVQTQEEPVAAQDVDDRLPSSDVDEQLSQQIAADMARALSQVEQARRDESSTGALDKPSLRKRKSSASKSPEKQTRKSPRRTNVKVVIKKGVDVSKEVAQDEPTVDDDGMLDCIVVATAPYKDPPKNSAQKPKREAARSTPKPRRRISIGPFTSKRRYSSRLSQVSGRAGSFYMDESDDAKVHGESSHDGIAPAEEDRAEPNAEGTRQSFSTEHEESVTSPKGAVHPENTASSFANRMRESKAETHTSATHFPTSTTSPMQSNSTMDETSGMVQTAGNDLLLRLQALVEEANHVVVNHGEQRALLSTWMDLGQALHHADAASRAAKPS